MDRSPKAGTDKKREATNKHQSLVEKEKPRGGNDDAAGGDGGRGKQAGDGGRKVKKGVGAKGGEGKWGGTKAGKYEEDEGDVDDDNTFRHACPFCGCPPGIVMYYGSSCGGCFCHED